MVAKLVFFLLVLVVLLCAVVIAAYRYFDRQAEREHEKEMQQMEHTERLVNQAEREYGRDRDN